MLAMMYRVWKAKCMLVHHLRRLEDHSLTKMVFTKQITNNWPGLVKEVRIICQNLDTKDASVTSMSKFCYRKVVEITCRGKYEVDMPAGMVGMTKMEMLLDDDCSRKEYMAIQSLNEVRKTFRMRAQLLDDFKAQGQPQEQVQGR